MQNNLDWLGCSVIHIDYLVNSFFHISELWLKVMEPEHIFWGVLGFSWIEFLWGGYLGRRQRKIYKKHVTVPDEAKDLLDADTFTKARLYALDKSNFGAVSGWFNQILSSFLMVYFAFAFLWRIAGDFIVELGFDKSDEIYRSMMFVLLSNIFSTIIGMSSGSSEGSRSRNKRIKTWETRRKKISSNGNEFCTV